MTISFSKENVEKRKFVEKIWHGLLDHNIVSKEVGHDFWYDKNRDWLDPSPMPPKLHTIREDKSNRWKAGNDIHFVINNRTPERFQFAPVVKCVSVQEIEIKYKHAEDLPDVFIDGCDMWKKGQPGIKECFKEIEQLAINDGFDSMLQFFLYFNTDFKGKIIHWTDLKY